MANDTDRTLHDVIATIEAGEFYSDYDQSVSDLAILRATLSQPEAAGGGVRDAGAKLAKAVYGVELAALSTPQDIPRVSEDGGDEQLRPLSETQSAFKVVKDEFFAAIDTMGAHGPYTPITVGCGTEDGGEAKPEPWGYYFWKSNGDGTESPETVQGPIPGWYRGIRSITPLYLAPPSDEATQLRAENERWRANMRDAHEAFSAMRNSINEVVPMQSAEADLLSGPEWSVSCHAVADAVIAKAAQLRAEVERLTRERQELSDYAFEATKAITGMTAGGSEYFAGKLPDGRYKADLSFCVQRIRDRFEAEAKAHRGRQERAEAELAALKAGEVTDRKFALGDRVTKIKGSSWTGHVVGFYSTTLTPIGYAVESETETGSVQIYPESALKHGGGHE